MRALYAARFTGPSEFLAHDAAERFLQPFALAPGVFLERVVDERLVISPARRGDLTAKPIQQPGCARDHNSLERSGGV